MARRLSIAFRGADSGTEDLTWAQRSYWRAAINYGVTEPAGGMMQLAAGTTVEDMATLLRYLMGRHQALRTRIFLDAQGNPRQGVLGAGEIELELIDADDTADPSVIAEALRVVYDCAKWDYGCDWPVRMAVVCQGGLASHLSYLAGYPDAGKDPGELRTVAAVAGGQQHGEGFAALFAARCSCVVQPPPRASQRVVGRLLQRPAWGSFCDSARRRAPAAARLMVESTLGGPDRGAYAAPE